MSMRVALRRPRFDTVPSGWRIRTDKKAIVR
jgi:hypothetical protein